MFKTELNRYLKNPLNLFFSLVFPVGLLLIFGLTNGLDNRIDYISIILLTSLSITVTPISTALCSDKVEKRIKHYLLIDKAFWKYLGTMFLMNFIIFQITVWLIVLIAVTAFNAMINWQIGLMLVFLPPIMYTMGFMIGSMIGSWSKSLAVCMPFGLFVLFAMMFLGGMSYPIHFLNPNEFFYIESTSIWGQTLMLFNHVYQGIMHAPGFDHLILSNLQLGITIGLIVVLPALISTGFFFSLKNFKK